MTTDICQHIITQKSRGKDRKGMLCGQFTFDSKNSKYCKQHISRHPEIENESDICVRTFKVRFYPNIKQKKLLAIHFGGARFTFNKCVENKLDVNKDELEIKKEYITNLPNKYKFLKLVPKEIRTFALKEYITSLKNCKIEYIKKLKREEWKIKNYSNYKSKNIIKPIINFRRKKSDQSITINKDAIKIIDGKMYIYKKIYQNMHINFNFRSKRDKRLNKILKGTIYHDIKVIKTKTNKYYICFTDDIKIEDKNKEIKIDEIKVCSVDPGGRTFMTTYAENEVYEIGNNINKELGELFKIKDELQIEYFKKINKIKKGKIKLQKMIFL